MKARIERFDSRVGDGLVIEVKRWRGLGSMTVNVTKNDSQAKRNYAR